MIAIAIAAGVALAVALAVIMAFSVGIGIQARRYKDVRVTVMRAELADEETSPEGVAKLPRLA